MKRTRCKPGDLALVIYDTPDCLKNVGRLVRVRGPLQLNIGLGLKCWLIHPVSPEPYWIGWPSTTRSQVVKPTDQIEHPDRWLLPLRPQRPEDAWRILARRKQPNPKIAKEVARTAELQARIEQTRVDRKRYKERHAWVLSPESPSDLTILPVDWDQRLAALLRSM